MYCSDRLLSTIEIYFVGIHTFSTSKAFWRLSATNLGVTQIQEQSKDAVVKLLPLPCPLWGDAIAEHIQAASRQ